MEIDKFVHLNKLFILYRALLTEKQATTLEYYFGEDLSLGEISEEINVSRQAVHDTIKRCEAILMDYEVKLGLYRKEKEDSQKIEEILELLNEIQSQYNLKDDKLDKIKYICKELSE